MADMTLDEAVKWLRDHVGDLRSAARVLRESPWGAKLAATAAAVDKAADEGTLAIAALEAAREDGWQPMETAPKPDIGANGFGKRLLIVVDCGDGTIQSVRRGYWAGTDWYLDCCNGLATACGYRVTHWRPLPAPPAIDQARGEESGND